VIETRFVCLRGGRGFLKAVRILLTILLLYRKTDSICLERISSFAPQNVARFIVWQQLCDASPRVYTMIIVSVLHWNHRTCVHRTHEQFENCHETSTRYEPLECNGSRRVKMNSGTTDSRRHTRWNWERFTVPTEL